MGQRKARAPGILLALALPAVGVRAHEDLELQIQAATRQIEADPKNALLYLRRGELHRFHQDWPAAQADYARAARLDPGLDAVHLARGKMWVEAGDGKLGGESLDRFLSAHPGHADAVFHRARALVLAGDRRSAVGLFTKAIALFDEPGPEHYLERAETLAADGHGEEAVRGLDEGIRRLGPLVTLQIRAIDLDVAGRRFDAALARIERVLASAERRDTWLARKAEVLAQAGRPQEAREASLQALAALETLHPRQRNARSARELERRLRAAVEADEGSRR
jgi:tetratricopeptide (TPR) repeat protein